MAIDFKPFEELFASEYQRNYIIWGHIDVGPNSYNVFKKYTTKKRQQIFQVCKKYLQWEITQKQEEWERLMYMYQFIIKSPPPFPYLEYPLSEEIIMAITWKKKITVLDVKRGNVSVTLNRIDNTDPEKVKTLNTCTVLDALINTPELKQQVVVELKRQYEEQKQKVINDAAIIGTFGDDLDAAIVEMEKL